MLPSFFDHRIRWQATALGVEARLPARRSGPQVGLLGFWLCGWAVGETAALVQLLNGGLKADNGAFLLVWLLAWTFGGSVAVATLAWLLAGREIVRVENGRLSVAKKVGRLGPTYVYELREVRRLRLDEPTPAWGSSSRKASVWSMRRGKLAFDYRGEAQFFADGLEPADAETLLRALQGSRLFGTVGG